MVIRINENYKRAKNNNADIVIYTNMKAFINECITYYNKNILNEAGKSWKYNPNIDDIDNKQYRNNSKSNRRDNTYKKYQDDIDDDNNYLNPNDYKDMYDSQYINMNTTSTKSNKKFDINMLNNIDDIKYNKRTLNPNFTFGTALANAKGDILDYDNDMQNAIRTCMIHTIMNDIANINSNTVKDNKCYLPSNNMSKNILMISAHTSQQKGLSVYIHIWFKPNKYDRIVYNIQGSSSVSLSNNNDYMESNYYLTIKISDHASIISNHAPYKPYKDMVNGNAINNINLRDISGRTIANVQRDLKSVINKWDNDYIKDYITNGSVIEQEKKVTIPTNNNIPMPLSASYNRKSNKYKSFNEINRRW